MTSPAIWSSSQIGIQYNNADVAKLPLELISSIRESFDCYVDDEGRTILTENEKLWIAIVVFIWGSSAIIVLYIITRTVNVPYLGLEAEVNTIDIISKVLQVGLISWFNRSIENPKTC